MPQEMSFGEALLAAIDEVAEQDPRIVMFNPSFAGEAGHEKLAALRKKYAARIKYPPIAEIGFSSGSGETLPFSIFARPTISQPRPPSVV